MIEEKEIEKLLDKLAKRAHERDTYHLDYDGTSPDYQKMLRQRALHTIYDLANMGFDIVKKKE